MSNKTIKDALKSILESGDEVYSIPCTVESVDLTKKTCYCIPLDKRADLPSVKLIVADVGFMLVPKVNSIVFVTMLNDTNGYLGMASEVDTILLNGDAYSGIIKVDDLLTEINNRNTTFKTAITAALTSLDASIVALGGVSASATAFTSATATIINILKAQVENTTVKHGNGT